MWPSSDWSISGSDNVVILKEILIQQCCCQIGNEGAVGTFAAWRPMLSLGAVQTRVPAVVPGFPLVASRRRYLSEPFNVAHGGAPKYRLGDVLGDPDVGSKAFSDSERSRLIRHSRLDGRPFVFPLQQGRPVPSDAWMPVGHESIEKGLPTGRTSGRVLSGPIG